MSQRKAPEAGCIRQQFDLHVVKQGLNTEQLISWSQLYSHQLLGICCRTVRAELCRSGFCQNVQLMDEDGKPTGGLRLVLGPCKGCVGPHGNLILAERAMAGAGSRSEGPGQHDDGVGDCDMGTDDEDVQQSSAGHGHRLASSDRMPSHARQHGSSNKGRLMPFALKGTSPAKLDELERFAWALLAMLQVGNLMVAAMLHQNHCC